MDNNEFDGILGGWNARHLPDLHTLLGLGDQEGAPQELHIKFSYQVSPDVPDFNGDMYSPYTHAQNEFFFKGDMTEYGIDLIRKMFGGHMSMEDVWAAFEENCEPLAPKADAVSSKPNVLRFSNQEIERLKQLKARVDSGEVERG